MEIVNVAFVFTIGLVGFLIGIFVKDYLPAYFKKKAENLATKQDLHELTRIVEEVKIAFTQETEKWKSDLQIFNGIKLGMATEERAAIIDFNIKYFRWFNAIIDTSLDSTNRENNTALDAYLKKIKGFYSDMNDCMAELLMNVPEPLGKLGQSQAYNVVNGAQEIFGKLDIGNSKKIAQRYIYATRLEEMALKLDNLAHSIIKDNTVEFENDDGKRHTKIDPEIIKESGVLIGKSADVQMKAARIRGLLEKDRVENPNKFKASPNIIFTDDLDALDLLCEIEDGSYEDVTRNEGETEEDQATAAGE